MAIFSGNKENGMSKPVGPSVSAQINMIGEGTVFEGTVRAESDVRVSGRIVGKLHVSGKVIVSQEGAVDGEIVAENADIAGVVEGDLNVAERLVLKGTARVTGTVRAGRLVIEDGATFDGKCEMGGRFVEAEELEARTLRDVGRPAVAESAE